MADIPLCDMHVEMHSLYLVISCHHSCGGLALARCSGSPRLIPPANVLT